MGNTPSKKACTEHELRLCVAGLEFERAAKLRNVVH